MIALLRRTASWAISQSTVEAAAECALRLVTAVHRAGDYTSALSFSSDAVELLKPRLGEDNIWLIRLRQRIGRDLCRLGRFEESEALLRQILEDCERALGPEAPDTLAACRRLASPLVNLGQRPDATSLFRRAADGYVRALGPVHPLTLLARSGVLEVSPKSIDVDAGSDLVMECRRELGDDHTITLITELNCAFSLKCAGRPEEALPYIRSAFAKFARRFGPDYPLAFNARSTLGAILHVLGQNTEAIEHLEEVAEGRTRVLGPNHPWTIYAKELLKQYRDSQRES
ncbi:tetratricopeptide repeat protein [Streptomyces sp. NPDC055140]